MNEIRLNLNLKNELQITDSVNYQLPGIFLVLSLLSVDKLSKDDYSMLWLRVLLPAKRVTNKNKDTYKIIRIGASIIYYLPNECYSNTFTMIFLCFPTAIPG